MKRFAAVLRPALALMALLAASSVASAQGPPCPPTCPPPPPPPIDITVSFGDFEDGDFVGQLVIPGCPVVIVEVSVTVADDEDGTTTIKLSSTTNTVDFTVGTVVQCIVYVSENPQEINITEWVVVTRYCDGTFVLEGTQNP